MFHLVITDSFVEIVLETVAAVIHFGLALFLRIHFGRQRTVTGNTPLAIARITGVSNFQIADISTLFGIRDTIPKLRSVKRSMNLSLDRPCVREFIDDCRMPLESFRQWVAVKFKEAASKSISIGNGVMMLMTAILLCKITGIRHIDASPMSGIDRTFVTNDNITVWASEEMPFKERVFGESEFATWGIPICEDWNMSDVADTFRNQFLATVPRMHVPDDMVVLSVRGCDIFTSPFTNYWQPPCSFYTDVQKRFKKSIVCASDDLNPCVNKSIEHGAVWPGGTAKEDFARMVWARNLAIGRSSFPRAALYMSPFGKNFYVFEGDGNSINSRWEMFFYRYLEHGDHWDCRASQEYRDMIVPNGTGRWNAKKKQLNLLLRDKCTWTRVALSERSYDPLPPSNHDVGCGWTVNM
jgi:hypothetical protein